MSLSNRRWKPGELLDEADVRLRKWHAQHGLCATCTRYHQSHETMAMAHKIADTKVNRKLYGDDVVDHPMAKALTCREARAGRDCNALQMLHGLPLADYAQKIRDIIDREEL